MIGYESCLEDGDEDRERERDREVAESGENDPKRRGTKLNLYSRHWSGVRRATVSRRDAPDRWGCRSRCSGQPEAAPCPRPAAPAGTGASR